MRKIKWLGKAEIWERGKQERRIDQAVVMLLRKIEPSG